MISLGSLGDYRRTKSGGQLANQSSPGKMAVKTVCLSGCKMQLRTYQMEAVTLRSREIVRNVILKVIAVKSATLRNCYDTYFWMPSFI